MERFHRPLSSVFQFKSGRDWAGRQACLGRQPVPVSMNGSKSLTCIEQATPIYVCVRQPVYVRTRMGRNLTRDPRPYSLHIGMRHVPC